MNKGMLSAVGVGVVALALTLSPASALAQGKGHARQVKPQKSAKVVKPAKHAKPVKPKTVALPLFGDHDRGVIHHYYSGLPPGLAKRQGDLPPGLQRQLQRNGVLPPGLRARIRPFPSALERQLNPLPRGYRRGILDRHVVVYRTDDYRIGDSIFDVLR
jgi:hypothetical protein